MGLEVVSWQIDHLPAPQISSPLPPASSYLNTLLYTEETGSCSHKHTERNSTFMESHPHPALPRFRYVYNQSALSAMKQMRLRCHSSPAADEKCCQGGKKNEG